MAKNKTINGRISKSLIKQQVNILDAVEALGIPTQKKGRRISILCPCHDDRHFGSCFLYNNNFHCYACNEQGDVIDLVQKKLGLDFQDTLSWFSDNFNGCFEYSEENLKKIKRVSRKKAIVEELMLSDEALRKIGLFNEPVKVIKKCSQTDYIKHDKLSAGETIKMDDNCGEIFVLSTVIKNPFRKLFIEDFPMYKYIVNNAIKQKIAETIYYWEMFQKKKISKKNPSSRNMALLYKQVKSSSNEKTAVETVKKSVREEIINLYSYMVDESNNPRNPVKTVDTTTEDVALYNLLNKVGLAQ